MWPSIREAKRVVSMTKSSKGVKDEDASPEDPEQV
jgi:hypothetical protein